MNPQIDASINCIAGHIASGLLIVSVFLSPTITVSQHVSDADLMFARQFLQEEYPDTDFTNPRDREAARILAQIKYHPNFVFGLERAWQIAANEGLHIASSPDRGFEEVVQRHGGRATFELAREYAVGEWPDDDLQDVEYEKAKNRQALKYLLPFYNKQEIEQQARLLRNLDPNSLLVSETKIADQVIEKYLKAKAMEKYRNTALMFFEDTQQTFEGMQPTVCMVGFCVESGIDLVVTAPGTSESNYSVNVRSEINPAARDLIDLRKAN